MKGENRDQTHLLSQALTSCTKKHVFSPLKLAILTRALKHIDFFEFFLFYLLFEEAANFHRQQVMYVKNLCNAFLKPLGFQHL